MKQAAEKNALIPALCYLLVSSIFFYPLFQGKVLIYLDNLLARAPAFSFLKLEVLQGRLPLWNPNIFAGMPFLADPSQGIFSPFNLTIFLFDNILQAVAFQAFILVFLGGLGGFFLAKSLGLKNLPSFLAGLSFGFSGSVMEVVNDVNSLSGIVLIPWTLSVFAREVMVKKRYFSWRLSLIFAFQLISGHTQYAYYTLLILAISFALAIKKRRIKFNKNTLTNIAAFFLTIFFAFCLSAVQLIPSGELILQSKRAKDVNDFNAETMELKTLPRLVLPTIYGRLTGGNSWGPGSQKEKGLANTVGYINFSAWLLAVLGIFKLWKKNKLIRLFAVVSAASFILSFGRQTALFSFFQRLAPGFQYFRSPLRILAIYSLGVSLLAGFSLEKMVFQKSRVKTGVKIFSRLSFFCIMLSFLALRFFPHSFGQIFLKTYENIKQIKIEQSLSYSLGKVEAISVLASRNLVLFMINLYSLSLLLYFIITKKKYYFCLGVLLIVFEMFFSVRGGMFFAGKEKLSADQSIVNFLKNNLEDQRFISISDIEPYTGIWVYFNHLITRPPFSTDKVYGEELDSWENLSYQLNLLPADTNQFYGLKTASGYAAVLPKRYRDFTNSERINSLDYLSYKNPILNEFGVKYLVSEKASKFLINDNAGQLVKAFESDKALIFENKLAKPRLDFFENKGSGKTSFVIAQENPGKIIIEGETDTGGRLILRDLYYPGWKAAIDDKKKKIEPFQEIFRAVVVDPGKHRIVFSFLPNSFIIGVVISLISLGLLCRIAFKK